MKNLDLIISVDTSVGHLAGALNVPTWLILPFAADPRWMVARDDSLWYPSMKLFRNGRDGDWQKLAQRLVAQLEQVVV